MRLAAAFHLCLVKTENIKNNNKLLIIIVGLANRKTNCINSELTNKYEGGKLVVSFIPGFEMCQIVLLEPVLDV